MTTTATEAPYSPDTSGSTESERKLVKDAEEKIQAASNARKPYEGTWNLCQHFLAGKQWTALSDEREARVISLKDTDEYRDRVRITINVLTRYIWTAVGKIAADDLRPDFTFTTQSKEAEQYASQANAAWRFGYENEIEGDRRIKSAILKMLTYGTSAIRARYDFGAGPVVATVPVVEGKAITDMTQARKIVAMAQQQGIQLEFKEIRAGRLAWDDYGPFEIFAPPGIDDDARFPWLALGRAVDLDELKLIYPDTADGLKEESLQSVSKVTTLKDASSGTSNEIGKLKNHTMVYSLFHRPTVEKPNGCVIHLTQGRMLDYVDTLPYERAGVKKAGIVMLRWRPVPDRWHAIGMVEPALGPQFELNRSVSQYTEMTDKNLGRVYVTKGTLTGINRPQGAIMEVVEMAPGAPLPQETPGTQPGPWIVQQSQMMKEHISDVLGMGVSSLGQAPRGITAYSAFAFMVEQDDRDLLVANQDIRDKVAELAHYSLQDIKQFWGQDKHVSLAGPDDQMQSFVFNASQMPSEFIVIAKKQVGVPTAASAEIQKVFDLFDRSIASGRPLPLDWLYESLMHGKALPLPKSQDATQRQKAELENMVLVHGQPVMPAPEDDDEMHVNVHVAGKAAHQMIPGQEQIVQMYDIHIQMHIQNAQQKMQAAALATQNAAGNEGPKFENQAAGAGAAQPPIA